MRKYLELMGGSISVDSQVGSGSTFSILLPDLDTASDEPAQTDLPATTGTPDAPWTAAGGAPVSLELLAGLRALETGLWHRCEQGNRVQDVKRFAAELERLATNSGCASLETYVERLGVAVRTYDAGRIRNLVAAFPELLARLHPPLD